MTTATSDAAHTAPSQLLFLSSRVPDRIEWTEERVLRRIYERQRSGLTMTGRDVRRESPRLLAAAERFFGTWVSALEAAGINPSTTVRRAITHTRESIITLLREHVAAGLSPSCRHPLLHGYERTVRRRFGTWTAALKAAGIEPVRRPSPPSVPVNTREGIIAHLREHAAAGLPVSSDHPLLRGIWIPAKRQFGSWAAALVAAGVKPTERSPKRARYTRESIISRLREHAAAGLPASADHPLLQNCWKAARHLFGSWAAARKAAGIEFVPRPSRVSLYTRESIIAKLREHAASGLPVSSRHPLLNKFSKIAQRQFGSWITALEAAGLEPLRRPSTPCVTVYTRETIVAKLREQATTGLPVTCNHPFLFGCKKAVRRLFGSWAAALEAAGLPPNIRRRAGRPSKCERGNQ